MKDEALKLFRSANREHLYFLWKKAKNNDLDGLNDDDRRLAEAMLLHEYGRFWILQKVSDSVYVWLYSSDEMATYYNRYRYTLEKVIFDLF